MPIQGRSQTGIINIPIGGGIVVDEVSHELPENVCTDGNNVRFRDGYVQKSEGYQDVFTAPVAVPTHVANLQVGSTNYWVHTTATGIYADDGSAQTNITGTALTGSGKVTSCVLGGVLILNNGSDVPQYWGGTGTAAALTGWTSTHRCRSLRAFKNYLIALNITKGATNYASMVKWSHYADPGSIPSSWDETDETKDAGELDIAETDDAIVDGLTLSNNTFVVYKERSAYGLQYLANNDIFRVFKLPGSYGALTTNCVAAYPNGHVVLTSGPDLITHYANEPTSIVSGKWRRWLENNIDAANYQAAFVATNVSKYEIWVCIPTSGSTYCNKALVWNWQENTFSLIDIPNLTHATFGAYERASGDWASLVGDWASWDGPWVTFDTSSRLIASSGNSLLYLMDEGGTKDGSTMTATFSKVGISLGDPDIRKLLRSVTLRVDGTAGDTLSVEAAVSDDVEGPYTYGTPVTYTIGTTRKADILASGRFVGIRVTSTGSNDWRIKSIGFDVKPLGVY